MRPMTREEWEARQSVVRRVYDEETGRTRLVKGDGEILEEIVSRQRHQEINKQATKSDGDAFRSRLGLNKSWGFKAEKGEVHTLWIPHSAYPSFLADHGDVVIGVAVVCPGKWRQAIIVIHLQNRCTYKVSPTQTLTPLFALAHSYRTKRIYPGKHCLQRSGLTSVLQ